MTDFAIYEDKIIIKRLLDHSPIGYILLDEHYYVHYINESFLNARRLKYSDVYGKKCYSISNGGVKCKRCAVEKAVKLKRPQRILRRDILADGSVRFMDDYAVLMPELKKADRKYILEIMVNRTKEYTINEQLSDELDRILAFFFNTLEKKDKYTATHSNNVRNISIKIARAMNLSQAEILDIAIAASLHDLGKLMIPLNIINKPGKLDEREFDIIKRHPIVSWNFIKDLSSFSTIKDIVRHHHEWVNGSGYPDHLTINELSLGAKIVAIADCYDAINSNRPYHPAAGHAKTIEIMKNEVGTHYDAHVFEVFTKLDPNTFNIEEEFISRKESAIDRTILSSERPENQFIETEVSIEDFGSEIMKHSPCGFLVVNEALNVAYANPYFLDYTKTNIETVNEFVQQMPERENIVDFFNTMTTSQSRFEIMIDGAIKIYDIFLEGFTNEKTNKKTVVEILFDRTDEVLAKRQRNQDYKMLIQNILKNIMVFSSGIEDPLILEDLNLLIDRLNDSILKIDEQ